MRGKRYQALIVAILLLTALPYSPFLSRASSIEKNPLAEIDRDGDGIPDTNYLWGLIPMILIWMEMASQIWLKWISGTIW